VCIEFPNEAFLCAEEQFAEAETLYVNSITTGQEGMHYVYWYLTGTETEIGFWAFNMREPPAPAPPPPAAPPPPVAPPSGAAPAQPTLVCVTARRLVRRLQGQLRKATTQKQKVKFRSKLRRARASIRRVC
jgi:hypothetical protein